MKNYLPKKPVLLLLLVGAAILPSCYNAKKATEQVNKADSKYPEVVAKLARDKYPCSVLLKGDTAVIFKDTTIFLDVECPDSLNNNPFEIVRTVTDTINHTITKVKTVRVPVTLPVRTAYITKYFEDSAKLFILTKSNNDCQSKVQTLQSKLDKKNKWFWWLLVLCIVLGALHIVRSKFKI